VSPPTLKIVVHNDPGIKINLQQISALKHKIGIESIQVIIGMVKDIDIDKVLSLLPRDYHLLFYTGTTAKGITLCRIKGKSRLFPFIWRCIPNPR
jgi:hypothetical protein